MVIKSALLILLVYETLIKEVKVIQQLMYFPLKLKTGFCNQIINDMML